MELFSSGARLFNRAVKLSVFGFLIFSTSLALADFDKALSVIPKKLPPKIKGGQPAEAKCHYYKTFMVKQIDAQQKGAESVTVSPWNGQRSSVCDEKPSKDEIKVKLVGEYFLGAKDSFIFLRRADEWNGGVPFAVFDSRTGTKIFNDVMEKEISFDDFSAPNPVINYRRLIDTGCSLLENDKCWEQVQKRFGLSAFNKPDCESGYQKAMTTFAESRCQSSPKGYETCFSEELQNAVKKWDGKSSVIAVPARAVLKGTKPQATHVTGSAACWPSN